MIPKKYLAGVDADDFDTPGIFGARHSRKPGSWRIICSYADGKRHKAKIFAKLAAAGQAEAKHSWEFHHIVEGQHYADVDFTGRLAQLYADELPCVLIAKEEHLAYNRVLHISETDELYREHGLPRKLQACSAAAFAEAKVRSNHPRLRLRVSAMLRLYHDLYAGDPVLDTIAKNVLNDTLTGLR
ncbi:MAG: hypothetical protein M3Y64_02430 [Gemmatimonadota bacterium]|nr:hypothetical protein [Gemmatimonadota bacterium]